MKDILNELVDLEIRKIELEDSLRLRVLFKLVLKYNSFYSHKVDCEEAILLEKLINMLKEYDDVKEYYSCTKKINQLLEHVFFEEDGQKYQSFDVSSRRLMLKKYY